jgi:hypothetical protein
LPVGTDNINLQRRCDPMKAICVPDGAQVGVMSAPGGW